MRFILHTMVFHACFSRFQSFVVTLSALLYLQPEEKELIKKQGASWYKTMVSDSEYTEFENFTKWLGVSQ